MRPHAFTCAIALALCALASCGRDADRDMSKDLSRAAPPQPTTTTTSPPNAPANVGAPSQAEKREGSNPQQGQVDPKQPEQRRDFQKTN